MELAGFRQSETDMSPDKTPVRSQCAKSKQSEAVVGALQESILYLFSVSWVVYKRRVVLPPPESTLRRSFGC